MATRQEMEDAIRTIELQFGQDSSDLEELDLIDIKEIYNEYMDKYAKLSEPPTMSMARSGGEVLARPMFKPQIVRRQTGTPITGEMKDVLRDEFQASENNIKNLSSLTPNARDVLMEALSMRNIGVFKEKPELDDYGKTVIDPEFQNFLLSTYGERGQSILDTLLQGNNSENFSMLTGLMNEFTNFKISNEMKEKEAVPSRSDGLSEAEKNFLNRLKNRAEGSPMEGERSDAVGIADGLDQETMQADPNTEGVAKVSPEQYVELMNQVRGDEVPMEGRVQELAMTVGEKDAQDTPLSVLALVQPVFELQEQQGGLAAAPGAQQMMQQQVPMMMAKDGGIVQRFNGSDPMGENAQNLFSALGGSGVYDPAKLQIADALAKVYGVTADPFDTQGARQKYEQMLIDKEGLRDEAFLAAAPEFLQLGAAALTPGATMADILTQAATGVARFGTTQGKKLKNLESQALKMALADKATQDKSKQAYIGAITGPLLEDALKTTTESALEDLTIEEMTVKVAGDKLDNLLKDTDLTSKNLELSYADETLKTELLNKKADLEKNLILLETLPEKERLQNESLINQNKLAIAQIEAADLTNQLTQFDIDKRPITDALAIENQTIANLSAQLDLNQKPELLEQQLLQLKGNNEKLYKELDIFDQVTAQTFYKNQLDIEKIEKEINDPSKDKDQIKGEADLRKEYNKNASVEGLVKRNGYYTQIRNALLEPISEEQALKMAEGTNDEDFKKMLRDNPSGAKDLIIMFNFMKMLDPDSVVREGEQLLLKKTNPITEKYQTFIDTINGGGFLGPKQKQMLLQETKILMDTSFNDFLDQRQNYVDIGIDNFGDKFNAETQLPMPSLDVYQNDVTSGIIEKLILGDGVDTTVNGKTYKFPRFLSGG